MSNTLLKVGASVVLALLASSISTSNAFAQAAGCFQSPAKLNEAEINAFIASPASLLSENPTGGLPMSSRVRALSGSSADTLDLIISLVAQASPEQKAAIGSGLARAARACAAVNPEYAALIQEKVAGVTDPAVITAFLAASNEVQTAALGAGAAGGGTAAAGIGGGGTAGVGSGNAGGDVTTAQSTSGYSTSGSGQYFASEQSSVSATNQ
ncbi:hypothetical protein HGO38_30695 [Rhizobium sp. CG5]|uniref:hypothetical protein n=1 Tax=Rhizobium sp. CG5 TaxID=2726076 RepID=UPI002033708D|nr:hypothetical protein [Rhizobium sp. CG5]MCM2477818.1 hypothetical protein [Rhizobium sp. CG5]